MKRSLTTMFLLKIFLNVSSQCTRPQPEFRLNGDYLLGGLFDIHYIGSSTLHDRPEVLVCSSQDFLVSSYRRFQTMRFAVEEINNMTELLPNVSLGYEIFDHCSNANNFPGIFKFISLNGSVQPWFHISQGLSNVTAVIGPFSSSDTKTIAPLLMMNMVPLVSYGASSSAFSEKVKYPSFLRTVHSNKELVDVIVDILLYFKWHWVAFLNSDDDYGNDGWDLFQKRIKDTEICIAYQQEVNYHTDESELLEQIEAQNIQVVVAFVVEGNAEDLLGTIIQLDNVTKKVWIAVDDWSLNKKIPKMKGIGDIGTVIGVSQPAVHIPGFKEFIYSLRDQSQCQNKRGEFCNQFCNCSGLTPEGILSADHSFSFCVYAAVHAIARALHRVLQCDSGQCFTNTTVYPYKLLAELRKSNFTLLNETIQFDKNDNPKFGTYSIVFWNKSGAAEEIGFYSFYPSVSFYINTSKIEWHTNENVPSSLCSSTCPVGHAKKQDGLHKCCFTCHMCQNGTYINITADAYTCVDCKRDEWSTEGSTSCNLRSVEYIPYSDPAAVLILVGTVALLGLTLMTSVLFAVHYHTPVVRSAGGPMCFLILVCLGLSSLSVFFSFDKPTVPACVLRYLPFLLFYTVCLACFVVRSFQIVFIFKIAAKYPFVHSWWMKYQGQWLVITLAFIIQIILLIFGYSFAPPSPFNNTEWDQTKIILGCGIHFKAATASIVLLLVLGLLCFIFSYMGKDLPKNYNEAKSITFCLLLIILTWIIFTSQFILYQGKYIQTLNALAVLSSLYAFLLWYFLPKCYLIIFQPHKNTQKYFQGLIQSYTKTISQ